MKRADNDLKKTPEDWLRSVDGSPEDRGRGRLKLFLGYAPGVGKTFSMLSEGIRRRARGEDVVIGVVETHGRSGTAQLAEQLEHIPRREVEYKGTIFTELDVSGVVKRAPRVVLIDELAHTNVEGSDHAKRYDDVLQILGAGIDVLSTVNVQHVESLAPRVQAITGITVREQVPDWVLDQADEIVLSDLTPEALVTRMRRGDVYPADRVERSLANFFRRGNLIALREMALQRVTRAVDRTLEDYVKRKKLGGHWSIAERVAVCISSNAQARDLIARGARLAEALNAELYVIHVESVHDARSERALALNAALTLARNLGANIAPLKGKDTARTTATFIREQRITQAIVGRSATHGLRSYLYYLALQRFMAEAPHVDLHIVTQEAK